MSEETKSLERQLKTLYKKKVREKINTYKETYRYRPEKFVEWLENEIKKVSYFNADETSNH